MWYVSQLGSPNAAARFPGPTAGTSSVSRAWAAAIQSLLHCRLHRDPDAASRTRDRGRNGSVRIVVDLHPEPAESASDPLAKDRAVLDEIGARERAERMMAAEHHRRVDVGRDRESLGMAGLAYAHRVDQIID
jgi:hypothetical protein